MHWLASDITKIHRAPFSCHSGIIFFFLAQSGIDSFVELDKTPLKLGNQIVSIIS